MEKIKKKVGRDSTYTKKMGDDICLAISTSILGLEHLCKENPHWPCRQSILEWRLTIPEFGDNYARAKQAQVEALIDDALKTAYESSYDTKLNSEGYEVCNIDWIARCRLKIDTIKWIACKLAPKIYGDKVQTEHSGNVKMTHEEAIKELE